jgi:hypothetical protein
LDFIFSLIGRDFFRAEPLYIYQYHDHNGVSAFGKGLLRRICRAWAEEAIVAWRFVAGMQCWLLLSRGKRGRLGYVVRQFRTDCRHADDPRALGVTLRA